MIWADSLLEYIPGNTELTGNEITHICNLQAFIEEQEQTSSDSPRRKAIQQMIYASSQRCLNFATLDALERLDNLKQSQPNCADAIAAIRRHVALCLRADVPVLGFPPLLLDGPPGIGKTRFAKSLASALASEIAFINCSSVSAGFVLGGSNSTWRDSRPGRVFETIRDKRSANPIIVLDEIDKLGGNRQFDGYGPLYQLLEHDTAGHFVDEHIGLPVDASRIIWIGTSNNIHEIPEPIQSRFETVRLDKPGHDDVAAIVQSVYSDLVNQDKGWRRVFPRKLAPDVIETLATLPPRQVRRELMTAMGNASLRGMQCKRLSVTVNDIEAVAPTQHPGPGFL